MKKNNHILIGAIIIVIIISGYLIYQNNISLPPTQQTQSQNQPTQETGKVGDIVIEEDEDSEQQPPVDSLSFTLSTDKEFYTEKEPIIATLNITNNDSQKICVLLPQMIANKNSGKSGFVMDLVNSSQKVVRKTQEKREQALSFIIFEAGETQQIITYDLLKLYGVLKADKYTVVGNYWPTSLDYEQFYDDAAKQQCQPRTLSRTSLNHMVIKIQSNNQENTIQKHISNWKNESSLYELHWIMNNVLKEGMTQDEVLNSLGNPISKNSDDSWVYTVGLVGIIIEFEEKRVISFEGLII